MKDSLKAPAVSSLPFLSDLSIPVLSETVWAGNSVLRWAMALGTIVLLCVIARLVKAVIVSRLKRLAAHTETSKDDAWIHVLEAPTWFGYLALGLTLARPFVELSKTANLVLSGATFILVGLQIAVWAQRVLDVALKQWAGRDENARKDTAAAAIRFMGRLLIWTVLSLSVLSNLGVEITTVVAGLGVGGVAAALAVQSILSDLFAGLSMYFDRPFDIGDFIIVGDVMGNVRKIGLRTTRIDSLGGEKIVYPNGELTKNFIRNYAWMRERRIVFAFGIEYNIDPALLERAREIVKEIVEAQQDVRFDRAHFKSYGAYSLDYEVVYYVLSPDFNIYMDKQHAINVELYRRFADEGIPFAFPTRTIYTRTEEPEDEPASGKKDGDRVSGAVPSAQH